MKPWCFLRIATECLPLFSCRHASYPVDQTHRLPRYIKPQTKHRMGYNALQARRSRARRSRGSDASAHARLHQQKRCGHGAHANSKRRGKRRLTNPFQPADADQQGGERNPDQVMQRPSEQVFSSHRRSGHNRVMTKAPMPHMADPAPHQCIVWWRHAEQRSPDDPPQIHDRSCANAER